MPALTNSVHIKLNARWEELTQLNDWIIEAKEKLQLSDEQTFVLDLVVEEIVTNIIKYGYREEGGPLEVACDIDAERALRIIIRDQGEPFDPTQAAQPDLTTGVQDRPIGGLGVFLVCEMADAITYDHDEYTGWNELIVVKHPAAIDALAPLIEFLQRMPMFSDVKEDTLRHLAAIAQHKRLAPGEVLFREGDVGAECYIVVAGDVDVIRQAGDETLLLERCRPGSIIGEMALIDNTPRAASVRARTSASLLRITEAEFVTLMHANPTTAMALLRGGTARLRGSTSRMMQGLERKNNELARAYEDLKAAQSELLRLERIERELAIAREIQRFFLPSSIPQPKGWQIAAFNEGANEVGGDFYDVLKLGDGRIGLVVADACGKGVGAALFVALTRSLLRSSSQALASRPDVIPDPHALLSTALLMTNNYISREHGASNMFTTLFYTIFTPETGAVDYINAGHNPPLIYNRVTSEIRELKATGLPLGIMEDVPYSVGSDMIGPDELLLAFSDGATEAFDIAGNVFNDESLVHVIRQRNYHDAASLINQICQAINAFVGRAPQADDITLLAVSRQVG